LLTTTALVALTAPACAEPVSLLAAGITAILSAAAPAGAGAVTIAGISATTFATVVASTVVAGASFAFSALSSRGRRSAVDPGQAKSTFETGTSGRLRAIGRVRIGGLKIFGNTVSTDRYRLVAHSAGPVDGVEAHYLGGREVTLEANGDVSSPPFARVGGSYVNIQSKPGNGAETSWPQLQSAFPTLWTSAHRARGIAQSLVTYVSPGISSAKFLKLYQSGPPDYERLQRGELLYDPRDGMTRWSDNAVLAILHVLLTFPDFELSDFDLDFIADEADRADEIVSTRTGAEKRARAWGIWDEDAIARGDLIDQLLVSTGCELVTRPGEKIGIQLVDDLRQPEIHFPAKHVVSFGLKAGPDGIERPNVCRVTYYSPERKYELSEIPLVVDSTQPAPQPLPWARVESEIQRVGEKVLELSLPFCPSAAQAQRIARRLFALNRADAGTLKTNMAGLAAWGAKTASVEVPDLDETITLEIAAASIDDESGTVEIPFRVQPDLAAWNPAIDEALPPDPVPDIEFEGGMSQPAAPNAACIVTFPGGATETRVGYADYGPSITIEAVFRSYTAGQPNPWQSMLENRAPGGASIAFVAGAVAQPIDVRIRQFNTEEDGSIWSPIYSVTPTAINTAPAAPGFTKVERLSELLVDFTITAPNDLHVSYLIFTWAGDVVSPGSQVYNCRPGQVITRTEQMLPPSNIAGVTGTFTARAYSSTGAASALVTLTVSMPSTGT
jgi:Putative phage tail protein